MRIGGYIAAGLVLLILVVASGALFTVSQTEQALVLYFGQPVRVIADPGLHAKVPFFESVVDLDNRIIDLESDKQEVLASDNQRILVDAFLRYHIADPLKFYQTVGTVSRANNQLGSILSSALRRVLGEVTLTQIVREQRAQLMVRIRDLVNTEGGRLGVAVNDVRIRRADLPAELSEKIYDRMKSERGREAAEYRAKGSEQAQTTRADADRQVVVLRAEAQNKADTMRGMGDAERNRIFAEAYGRDPEVLRVLPHHAGLCVEPAARPHEAGAEPRLGLLPLLQQPGRHAGSGDGVIDARRRPIRSADRRRACGRPASRWRCSCRRCSCRGCFCRHPAPGALRRARRPRGLRAAGAVNCRPAGLLYGEGGRGGSDEKAGRSRHPLSPRGMLP